MGAWTVAGGGVDHIATYWAAAEGNQSLDLNALTDGRIEQTLTVVPGQAYGLGFLYAANTAGGPQFRSFHVEVQGVQVGQEFVFDAAGKSAQNMGWKTGQVLFTPTSSAITIAFDSDTGGGWFGPALDGVYLGVGSGPSGQLTPLETSGGGNPAWLNQCFKIRCDPFNTSTGEFFENVTDLKVAGRGPGMDATRSYSSQLSTNDGPLGKGWSLNYAMNLFKDPATGVVTVHQENGSVVTFTPDVSGGYTAPSRVLATLVLNADGSWTYDRRARQIFTFTNAGQLSNLRDLNGEAVTVAHNGSGQITTVTDGAGRALTFDYNTGGRIATITDPAGRFATYGYDTSGRLNAVTEPGGALTGYGYDPSSGLLSTHTDPNGKTMTNTYDTAHRIKTQVDAAGGITTIAFGADGATTVTSPGGRVAIDRYTNGQRTSVTEGAGTKAAATSTYTYDPATLALATVRDPNGHTSTYTTDAAGNRLTDTDANAHTQSWTYDALNDVLTATDRNGHTTTNTYDSRGNQLTSSRPLTGTTQLQTGVHTRTNPDHPGDVTSVTDPTGRVTTFTYDINGNPATSSDAAGNTTTFVFDVLGRRASIKTPRLNTTTDTYDSAGRLWKVTDALGHITTNLYDAGGNLTSVRDPKGNITTNAYDALNQPINVLAADGATSTTAYDPDGNQIGHTDPAGHTTNYTYDAQSRLASSKDPANRTTRFGHDTAGNLTSMTDQLLRVTTYGYDPANRRTTVGYSDGTTPNAAFGYTPAGQRATMDDGTGTTTYTYDSLNQLTDLSNGAGQHTGYGYDLSGRLTRLTYPNTKDVTRGYDSAGRLNSIADWLGHTTTIVPDADGNPASTNYGNTVKANSTFDEVGQMSSTTDLSPTDTTLASLTYTRDANSQVASSTPTGLTQGTETYGYSTRNQLNSINTGTYAYDAAGNPTTLADGTTQTFDTTDQVTSATTAGATTAYTYDGLGNRTASTPTTGAQTTYAYDQASHLTTAQKGASPATYTYNWDGLRTSRTTTAGTQNYAWDPTSGTPLMLTDGTTNYIYDDAGSPVEQIDATGAALYYQHDQYGSTRLLTNQAGAVAATFSYDPYGNLTSHTGTADTPLRWNGQYQDTDTGLYYLRARYYDPSTTQFLTRDPLEALTQDAYGYGGGNALNNSDPSGLAAGGSCDENDPTTFSGFLHGLAMAMVVAASDGEALPGGGELLAPEGELLAPAGADVLAATPLGRQYTAHYLNDTGPVRNIPGSVVDETLDYGTLAKDLPDRRVFYDPKNDITVVQSKTTGKIMSVRRGDVP